MKHLRCSEKINSLKTKLHAKFVAILVCLFFIFHFTIKSLLFTSSPTPSLLFILILLFFQVEVMYRLLLVLAVVSAGQGYKKHASTYPNTYKGPVIGVLAQKTYDKWRRYGNSYIAASYVKYLQGAGAQVLTNKYKFRVPSTRDSFRSTYCSKNVQPITMLVIISIQHATYSVHSISGGPCIGLSVTR